MKKKLVGQTCVYCATASAATMDHVFARSFFAETQRGNLPQVPACAPCNNEKAKLEHYLATVLLFGGQHPDAHAMLKEKGARRLAENAKLQRELASSIQYVKIKDIAGQDVERMTLDIHGERLELLFAFITKGLLWHHWSVRLDDEHAVSVLSLSAVGQEYFAPLLKRDAAQRASANLGNGTFIYEGTQGVDYPEFSFWGFSVYGNAQLSGDISVLNEQSLGLCAFTGRKEVFESENYKALIGSLSD